MTLPLYKGNTNEVLPFFCLQISKDMGIFPSMTQLQIETERRRSEEKEKKRKDIIRIVCALISSNAEYDSLTEAIDEAEIIYNEINSRI